jgi:hypothetical protein
LHISGLGEHVDEIGETANPSFVEDSVFMFVDGQAIHAAYQVLHLPVFFLLR